MISDTLHNILCRFRNSGRLFSMAFGVFGRWFAEAKLWTHREPMVSMFRWIWPWFWRGFSILSNSVWKIGYRSTNTCHIASFHQNLLWQTHPFMSVGGYSVMIMDCWIITFTNSSTHSNTDSCVSYRRGQPAGREQGWWGVLLRDTWVKPLARRGMGIEPLTFRFHPLADSVIRKRHI